MLKVCQELSWQSDVSSVYHNPPIAATIGAVGIYCLIVVGTDVFLV